MDAAEALFRRAVRDQRLGRYRRAASLYEEVLRLRPGLAIAEENLCLALLGAGDLEAGFARYDVRFARDLGRVERPALSFPEWRGEPLTGRSILVWMEQGYGDQIMYARFVPVLAEMGAEVSLLTPPPLTRLFSGLPARIVEAAGEVRIPRHDFWILPASIPARLRIREETLPRSPYLQGRAGGEGLGVAWRGDPKHPANPQRSLTPEHRAVLESLPGALSLLPEDTGAADFEATAEIVRGLERVITVDTSIAHMAAAMGKPVWLLLSAQDCCWRWQSGRPDSPWYPSMRLFRQTRPGDWRPVLEAVRDALETAEA
jgi:hypothetical protein